MNISTLGDFIRWQMETRRLSGREFARLIKVSETQINKFANYGNETHYSGRPIGQPSLEFLYKLAKGTSTDLAAIIALIYPDATRIHPTALIITDRVDALPADKRDLFDKFLEWLSFQGGNEAE